MKSSLLVALTALVAFERGTLLAQPPAGGQTQTPTFRSGVDLTPIDVTVVNDSGQPIDDLKPGDFQVKVDGKARRVVSAEWIPLARPQTGPPLAPLPEGYSSNENTTSGRLLLIAVDQPNIHFDGIAGLRSTVNAFIDRVQPSDPISAVGLGGGPTTPFTTDRDRVKKALALMSGHSQRGQVLKVLRQLEYWRDLAMSSVEAVDMYQGLTSTLDAVAVRECKIWPPNGGAELIILTGTDLETCRQTILSDARASGSAEVADRQQTLMSLRTLLLGLAAIDAPKTLVLVSEGFSLNDDPQSVSEIGSLAAAARTSVYVLKLDDQPFDVSQSAPTFSGPGDRQQLAAGLDVIASTSRGALFNVMGNASAAVARLERELSGYYLVAVESAPTDADGKAHPINVLVSRRGAVVRARRELAHAPAGKPGTPSPLEAVTAAINMPLPSSGLPLRVATFSLRDPNSSKIHVVIHADVGSGYTAAKAVTLAYVISDSKGAVVVNQIGNGRLAPPVNGVPSPLVYSGSASLDPGEYTLKLAATEGDLVGSIEHRIHAALIDAGALRLSELLIGGPLDAKALQSPTVGYDVRFGSVQGYLEAYGPSASLLTVKYEIAPDLNAPSLFGAVVPGRSAGDERTVFSYALPVRDLAPGRYFLRASLSDGSGSSVAKTARAFNVATVAAPVVVAGSPGAAPDSVVSSKPITLAVSDDLLAGTFRRADLSRRDTMQRFRDTVAPVAVRAFDEGTVLFAAGDDAQAETRFRSALESGLGGADSTAALAYLGATYAVTGRDLEAVGIWQVALVDGAGIPQIYEWIGEAFMRLRDFDQARATLEEAAGKWPGETRFAKPLAILYAKAGGGRQALQTLERYLTDHVEDTEAIALGIEWMAQVYAAGAEVNSRTEDLKLARAWADAYAKAAGPRADAVKGWMTSLDRTP